MLRCEVKLKSIFLYTGARYERVRSKNKNQRKARYCTVPTGTYVHMYNGHRRSQFFNTFIYLCLYIEVECWYIQYMRKQWVAENNGSALSIFIRIKC
jgi:hypothetical protein